MEKVFREIRCVSIGKNDVKFIPENLVKKPGYLDKHGLMVQELPEKLAEIKAEPLQNEDKTEEKPLVEAKKEGPKEKDPRPTEKIKVDA